MYISQVWKVCHSVTGVLWMSTLCRLIFQSKNTRFYWSELAYCAMVTDPLDPNLPPLAPKQNHTFLRFSAPVRIENKWIP